MLNGRMMDMPLLISSIIDYAADVEALLRYAADC